MDGISDANKRALVEYFRSGAKPAAGALGIELEHILVDGAGRPLPYAPVGESDRACVSNVLEALAADFPTETRHGGDLLGVSRPGAAITIEPAAQLELSAGPFRTIAEAHAAFMEFETRLSAVAEERGARVQAIGYDMAMKAADKTLIPKDRYRFMDRYLSRISPYGPCMMRGSASTQVSIDYACEADAVRKLRLANAAAPLLALIADNAPVFEGRPRAERMARTRIWVECDPARCSTVPGVFDRDFSFERYAEWILSTPAIVNVDPSGLPRYDERTFGEIFATVPMSAADVEHALSMVFPDARMKRYIEIRPADSMPVRYAIAYAAMVKGLFYAGESLEAMDELFEGVTKPQVDAAKESLMAKGYDGAAFGRSAASLADALVALAESGLPENERAFLAPIAELVERRTTLADLGGLSDPLA